MGARRSAAARYKRVVQTAQAIGGLAGTILTIYGRFRACQPLERRNLTFKF